MSEKSAPEDMLTPLLQASEETRLLLHATVTDHCTICTLSLYSSNLHPSLDIRRSRKVKIQMEACGKN